MFWVRYKSKLLLCCLKKIHQLISLCCITEEDLGKISVSFNVTLPWALFWHSPGGGGPKISMKTLNSITHPYARIIRWFKYDQDYLCVRLYKSVPVIFEPPCTMGTSQPCSKKANRYTIRFRIFTVITTKVDWKVSRLIFLFRIGWLYRPNNFLFFNLVSFILNTFFTAFYKRFKHMN